MSNGIFEGSSALLLDRITRSSWSAYYRADMMPSLTVVIFGSCPEIHALCILIWCLRVSMRYGVHPGRHIPVLIRVHDVILEIGFDILAEGFKLALGVILCDSVELLAHLVAVYIRIQRSEDVDNCKSRTHQKMIVCGNT